MQVYTHKERRKEEKIPRPEDYYMKDQFGRIIDYSEEALEADPKRKHRIINSVKEDFINSHLLATAPIT
jgi:hypothetical protein